MNLNDTDKKLLSYLYHHNREPFSKIAKETKLTRDQVEYRIKKYQEEGLIKKFATIYDYRALGYNCLTLILIKLSRYSSINKFIDKINDQNCISYGKVTGKFDVYMEAIFKNEEELSSFLASLLSESNEPIEDYVIMRPYQTELYALKFLGKNSKEPYLPVNQEYEKIKLDSKEKEILYLLEKDARIKLIDIATSLNISSELALYKIRKLTKDKIILGSRIAFNMNKLGYYYSGVLISMKNLSNENINKIRNFSRSHKYVNSFALSIGKPNCFIQFFHKTEEELRNSIKDLKEIFKDESLDLELIGIDEEEKANTLPIKL